MINHNQKGNYVNHRKFKRISKRWLFDQERFQAYRLNGEMKTIQVGEGEGGCL